MVEMEMNNITQGVKGLTVAVHNRAIDMAIDKLREKATKIDELLYNGKDIYLMSFGERRSRLCQKRNELYLKSFEIWNSIGKLYKLKMK